MKFCTYLTVYLGNRLPPFYIGHSSIKRVAKGYHGSVSSSKWKAIWKEELELHPELFKTKQLRTFATREQAVASEAKLHDHLDVRRHPLHINMCNASMRFYQEGPLQEHVKENLRRIKTGKKMSEKTKEKMRALTRSEETRAKIGEANRRRPPISDETRAKLKTRIKSPEHRQRMSDAAKARWARTRGNLVSSVC